MLADEDAFYEDEQATHLQHQDRRSLFSREQQAHLEETFCANQYPRREERLALAQELRVTEAQIRNWFQNRRARRGRR